jgi:hypothetical protein
MNGSPFKSRLAAASIGTAENSPPRVVGSMRKRNQSRRDDRGIPRTASWVISRFYPALRASRTFSPGVGTALAVPQTLGNFVAISRAWSLKFVTNLSSRPERTRISYFTRT